MPFTLSYPGAPDKRRDSRVRDLGPDGHVIAQVLTGGLSVSNAASELDVSRQTIYRRANRVTDAIRTALTPSKPGPKPAAETESESLGAARRENEAQRREILSLKAIQLLLLALIKGAGLLPDFRYLRLSAEQKLSLVEGMNAFVSAGGFANTFAAMIGQTYTKLLGWRTRICGLSRVEALVCLTDQSSAAVHETISEDVKHAVRTMKRRHPSWSPHQIANQLRRRRRPIQIGKTSVAQILRHANPEEPPDRGRRRKLHTFAEKGVAFCVDFMHVQMGLSSLKVCVVIDEATRYIVAWSVTQKTSSHLVIDLLRQASQRYGRPLLVKSDNGPEFRVSFAAMLATQGIFHLPSPRYYAPFNGKVERVFKQLRRYLRYAPLPATSWALRWLVAAFVKEHNTLHTNGNLGGITPQEAWELGGPISLPESTEQIKLRRQGDRLILRFTNRRDQQARREISLA